MESGCYICMVGYIKELKGCSKRESTVLLKSIVIVFRMFPQLVDSQSRLSLAEEEIQASGLQEMYISRKTGDAMDENIKISVINGSHKNQILQNENTDGPTGVVQGSTKYHACTSTPRYMLRKLTEDSEDQYGLTITFRLNRLF